jgi:hypothetical protein
MPDTGRRLLPLLGNAPVQVGDNKARRADRRFLQMCETIWSMEGIEKAERNRATASGKSLR